MSLTPYFFELSGEHPTLPAAEAYSCCAAEFDYFQYTAVGPGYSIIGFDPKRLGDVASRLALTHRVGRYLGSCGPGDVEKLASELELPPGSIAVRAKRYQENHPGLDLHQLASRVGAVVTKGRKVDLAHPEVELRVLVSDRVYFYLSEATIDRTVFERRKVAERPYFSPISLHPKYARALVNMSLVKRGGRLLDPFCGTGGILIEAASMGVKACGSDISPEMVEGCMRNMEHFGLPWDKIEVADIGDIAETFKDVDAVATDPPYGRATSTRREPIADLYARALPSIAAVLGRGSRAGVVLPNPCPEQHDGLELVHCHVQKVHRSLSRHYCVFRRR
jgi:tRNA (guanine10-N2)-dimethyltransferase